MRLGANGLRSFEAAVREGGQAEQSVGGEADADHDDDHDSPRLEGQASQDAPSRPVASAALYVIADRSRKKPTKPNPMPRPISPTAPRRLVQVTRALLTCPTCRARH